MKTTTRHAAGLLCGSIMLAALIDLLWAASAMTRPGSLGFAHIVGVLVTLGVFCAHALGRAQRADERGAVGHDQRGRAGER